jgi:hypothetical protein
MSAINRSEVKNHLHSPFLARIHLVQPESQSDATGFSAVEPDAVKADPSVLAEDFVAEHSSPGVAVTPTNQATVSIGPAGAPRIEKCESLNPHSAVTPRPGIGSRRAPPTRMRGCSRLSSWPGSEVRTRQ